MTRKTDQKLTVEINPRPFDSRKCISARENKLFKYTLLLHAKKCSSNVPLKSKLLNDISPIKLPRAARIDPACQDENKAIPLPKISDQIEDFNPIVSNAAPSTLIKPALIEENIGILAQVRASWSEEELNLLFRKMLLNFRSSRDESSFLIKEGIFTGTYFKIKKDGQKLNLNIKNAQKKAISLLAANKMVLKERLKHHEIELGVFKFC